MNNILENIKALLTGMSVGVIFALLRLPIPAPQVFAGISGIIGIWLGYIIIKSFWQLN